MVHQLFEIGQCPSQLDTQFILPPFFGKFIIVRDASKLQDLLPSDGEIICYHRLLSKLFINLGILRGVVLQYKQTDNKGLVLFRQTKN